MKQRLETLVQDVTRLDVLEESRLELLYDYARFLSDYDEANVIGVRDVDEILIEHVADSLSCLQYSAFMGAEKVVDIGSGGGLPAMPLSILMPRTMFVLVESTGKKVRFLREVIEYLGLENVKVENGRAEVVGAQIDHRAAYDLATTRALAQLDVVAEYCVPLLKVGGRLIAMKAAVGEAEIERAVKAAELLGARIEDVIKVKRSSLQADKQRNLVITEKVSQTPKKYPRRVGTPTKQPLGLPAE